MRYIDRSKVGVPGILLSERVHNEKDRMQQFFLNKEENKQTRYVFKSKIYGHQTVVDSLRQLFHNKCAYCEGIFVASHLNIDHFRPKRGAMNLNGMVHEDHYWWLTYEWENLYASCPVCNQSKRTRFPVKKKRANFGDRLSNELPLLIDPCNKEDFLVSQFNFDDEGRMQAETEKARITIEILNLNRNELVKARRKIIEELAFLFQVLNDQQQEEKRTELLLRIWEYCKPSSAYSAVAIHYLKGIGGIEKIISDQLGNIKLEEVINEIKPIIKAAAPIVKNVLKIPRERKRRQTYNLKLQSKAEKEAYFTSAKRINRIEINNFKLIKSLEINFPKPVANDEVWMVLLGENGSGKSTILQALALALAGKKKANQLGLNAADFVNRNTRKKEGFVKVFFEGMDDNIELSFSADSELFHSNYEDPKVILLAFGSTRLMSINEDKISNNNSTNLTNLFNAYATLPNVEKWIANPKNVNSRLFNKIAIELKRLLQLSDDKLIYRRIKKGNYGLFVKISEDKHGLRLKDLSAGYQSIIVLTLNIIKELLEVWKDINIAEGIVLIDEIGVHLHPKWKLQIISTLREIFPAMSFIITTHEPLCLRGVNKGEVVLLKYDENKEVIALTDLPSPSGLTVEQLINSKFFGLISTFDPEIEMKLNSYYLLNSKLNRTESEEIQLSQLHNELDEIDIFDEQGSVNVELSSLETGWISNPVRQDELKDRIKAIWNKGNLDL